MTMITPSYLGETIEYSSLHACRSTLEDPTLEHAGAGADAGSNAQERAGRRLVLSILLAHRYELGGLQLHDDYGYSLSVLRAAGR